MKILVLSQFFPPEMGALSARTYEHAKYWVSEGHEVIVVCGLPNYPDGIVPPEYQGKWLIRENWDGINILRGWLFVTPNRGVVKRSIAFLTYMLSSIIVATFFAGKCDVVMASSPQILCGLAGYIVSVFKWRPFVFEVRDLWPAQIIDLGVIKNKFIISILTALETFLYRHAKAIVTIAPAMSREIARRGFDENKIFTIPNGIDENVFKPLDTPNRIRKEKGWDDSKIVVLYIGTMGLSQGLKTILEVAERVKDDPRLLFVFVGAGADRDNLIRLSIQMQLNNVEFYPAVEKKEMPDWYASSDICLVSLKKRNVFKYNIPSKMFEIMACERPILLGAEGQARELLEQAEAGVAVEPENVDAYTEGLLVLANNPEIRKNAGKKGRAYVLEHFTRKTNAQKYLHVFQSVVTACPNNKI
ncbi:MAG TPA: glycosyltransferase family 4 protein [Candidatus Hydrogenedens sp.]|nr:glycosyltransferase family 4 protein [Candidatus Hydrogenedens sp.]HOL19117.1 glycosyltransferase family 4 protein [Candidatus Hydrogenedens sp.]HPP58065.1 glycosyltransferase family 4 protein [Candidatus Hydrogenedens sp.]